jgi:hypothetical protein
VAEGVEPVASTHWTASRRSPRTSAARIIRAPEAPRAWQAVPMPTSDAATLSWSRTRITCLAIPMVAFTIALYVGNALAPTLIKDAPVLLLVLAPKIRWLLLISNEVDALTFFVVPLVRATGVLAVYFLLGHWYGDRSLRLLEHRTGNALRPVLWVERNFHKARVPVTFLFPGNVSALLAGADRMPVILFFPVALASVALRLWLVRALAEVLRGPILEIVQWIGDNQLWLTVVSVALVMIWVGWSNRHGITQGETVEEIVEDFAPVPPATDDVEPTT